jgi:uncharacterized protein with HEPN domain
MLREWKLFFDDMLESCIKVLSYTEGLKQSQFESSAMNYDATLWNILLIGEAAKNIPEEIQSQMAEVPWRELIGFRNCLAHGYFGINNKILWQIIQEEMPKLQTNLLHIQTTRPELFKGQA